MAKENLLKELELAYAQDEKAGRGYWDGRATLVQARVTEVRNKVQAGIDKICIGYGVLSNPLTVYKYQQKVLGGEITFTNAMKEFKKGLYGR